MKNNIFNKSFTNKKIRLIPKSTDSIADIKSDSGAVVVNNKEVLACLAPKEKCDTMFFFDLPSFEFNHRANILENTVTSMTYVTYSHIEVNGVSYDLSKVIEFASSNVEYYESLDWYTSQGLDSLIGPFPEELQDILAICQVWKGYVGYHAEPYLNHNVLFRNKTQNTLNIKLIVRDEFKHFMSYIGHDELNKTVYIDSDNNINFVLDPRFEEDDWMEFTVTIDQYVSNWGQTAGQTIVDSLYFETFHSSPSNGYNFSPDDYLEIDWGDGSPVHKHIWHDAIDSPDRDKTSYYFYEEYSYQSPGTYTIRARSTVLMEYFFVQNVKSFNKWGKYFSAENYGFSSTWSSDNPYLEYVNPNIPSYVTYLEIDGMAVYSDIDLSAIDLTRTQVSYDYGNYTYAPLEDGDLNPPDDTHQFLFSKYADQIEARTINESPYLVLKFSNETTAGLNLQVVFNNLNLKYGTDSFLKEGDGISVKVFNKDVYLIIDRLVFTTDILKNCTLDLGWTDYKNSGRVTITKELYDTLPTFSTEGIISEIPTTKLSFDVYVDKVLKYGGVETFPTLIFAYDSSKSIIVLHDYSLYIGSYSNSNLTISLVDQETFKITDTPGSIVDVTYYTDNSYIPSLKTVEIPESGELFYINDTFTDESRFTEFHYGVLNRTTGLFANSSVKAKTFLGSVNMFNMGFSAMDMAITNAPVVENSTAWFEKKDGTRVSDILTKPELTTPLYNDLLESGEILSYCSLFKSKYDDSKTSFYKRELTYLGYHKIYPEDYFIFEVPVSSIATKEIHISMPVGVVGQFTYSILTPGLENTSVSLTYDWNPYNLSLYLFGRSIPSGITTIRFKMLLYKNTGILVSKPNQITLGSSVNVIQYGYSITPP